MILGFKPLHNATSIIPQINWQSISSEVVTCMNAGESDDII